MFCKTYLSLLQFLFLALAIDAMPETFLRDTTDIPDDQKELKVLDSSSGNSHIFPPHPEYEDNFLSFRKASEAFPEFFYHYDLPVKKGNSLDDISVMGLDGRGEDFSDSEAAKRGNHRSRPGGQKFRFDPALNRLGLGKRDSDRPKYNPGWKFIGLGKRIMPFLQGFNPSVFNTDKIESKDFKMGSSDALVPHYRILAMQDLSMFLDDIKERLEGALHRNNRSQSSVPDRLPLDLYSLGINEESSPKVKHSMSGGILAFRSQNENSMRSNRPQPFFTRSRKPTTMWRNKSKPMYDPGYLMTGLGK